MPYPDWYIVCRMVDSNNRALTEYRVIRGDQTVYSHDVLVEKTRDQIVSDINNNRATYKTAIVLPERHLHLDVGADVQVIVRNNLFVLTTKPNDSTEDNLSNLPTPSELVALLQLARRSLAVADPSPDAGTLAGMTDDEIGDRLEFRLVREGTPQWEVRYEPDDGPAVQVARVTARVVARPPYVVCLITDGEDIP
ncbi:MAG: DUF3892 domain-containing protein, partial [Myxococcales bacterium]